MIDLPDNLKSFALIPPRVESSSIVDDLLLQLAGSEVAAAQSKLEEIEARQAALERQGWVMVRLYALDDADLAAAADDGDSTFGEEQGPFPLDDLPDAPDVDQQDAVAGIITPDSATGRLAPVHCLYLRRMATVWDPPLSGALSTAHDVFMTASLCDALDHTDAPPPDVVENIHLPFERVCVTLSVPFRPTNATIYHPHYFRTPEHGARDPLPRMLAAHMSFVDNDWRIVGIVLSAGPGGVGLADEVIWIIEGGVDLTKPATALGRTIEGASAFPDMDNAAQFLCVAPIPGRLSRSNLRGFAHGVAALVSLKAPEPSAIFGDAEPFTAADAKAARKGTSSARRDATRGRFAPKVRVIDLTPSERTRDSEHSADRTVKSHWRRGHFRRARCGPRDDWWYETRWIAPVFVEGGRPAEGMQVWRATP